MDDLIEEVIQKQRQYFDSGATRDLDFRVMQLKNLRQAIEAHETDLLNAVKIDMNKPETEGWSSEIGFVYGEIDYTLRHLKRWSDSRRAVTPLLHFPSSTRLYQEPYGVVLIIGPWNYPFHLVMAPLVGAIAAGNCAVIKPSEIASATESITAQILAEAFESRYVTSITGGPRVAREILRHRFDYIFFTGSPTIGQNVMRAAAEHLTPVTLELGGKSPCIVDHTARLDIAARRIAWGKFWNAGQTCLAPDYLLVERSIKEALVAQLRTVLSQFYGSDPKDSPDYARIIDKRQFDRLVGLIEPSQVIHGGDYDAHTHYIAPTLMDHISLDDPVMGDEIFGPILPILEYERLDEAIQVVRHFPDPLALYLFSEDGETQRRIVAEVPYGCGCINDTLSQVINPGLPFGGRGRSGMGNYHGKYAFDTFSHTKGVITRSGWLDTRFRYPPYHMTLDFLRKLMKFTGQ